MSDRPPPPVGVPPADATGPKKFSPVLWKNFDQVYERITKGRHDVKSFKRYIDERMVIEEQYYKSLEKLVKSHSEFEATSSLNVTWKASLDATTSLANQHSQLVAFHKEMSKQMDDRMKEMKTAKTEIHKSWSYLLNDCITKSKKHEKAKQRYVDAVKTAETAVINRDNGLKEQFVDKKQKALEEKVKSSLKEVEQSHSAYEESVRLFKAAQELYDQKTLEYLEEFEAIERKRAEFIRHMFTRFTQFHEILKSSLDQTCLLLNKGIEQVDIQKDLDQFVTQYETKEPLPAHVVYQREESLIIEHALNGTSASRAAQPPPPTAMPPSSATTPTPTYAPVTTPIVAESKTPAAKPTGATPTAAPAVNARQPQAQAQQPQPQVQMAIALYDFETEEPSDLPFRAGDKIKILTMDNEWWTGELNGRTGSFPCNYVEISSANAVAATAAATTTAANAAAANANANTTAEAEKPRLMDGRCEALYEFVAQGPDELSFKQGEILYVTGELNGWYLGKSVDGARVGIFPANYVKML